MSDTAENLDLPATINQPQAAHAIMNYFLANADAGNHAANDELIAEMARYQRKQRDQHA